MTQPIKESESVSDKASGPEGREYLLGTGRIRRPHEVRGLPDSVLIGPSLDPLHVILVGQQLLELRPDLAPLQRQDAVEPLSGRQAGSLASKREY
jgi:hypothetical protein